MKLILFTIFSCSVLIARAQRVIDVEKADYPTARLYYTVGGAPVSTVKYVRVVSGSPFFNEGWLPGSLIISGGRRYDSLQLRLDLLANELHYLDESGNALVATTPVAELWIKDSSSNTRYHFLNSATISSSPAPQKGWYQLLTDGPAILLKNFDKAVSEVARYGTGVKDQTIMTLVKYCILSDNQLIYFKKVSELPGLLKDKKEALEKYIKSNRLDNKSEDSFINLVSYYNNIRNN